MQSSYAKNDVRFLLFMTFNQTFVNQQNSSIVESKSINEDSIFLLLTLLNFVIERQLLV